MMPSYAGMMNGKEEVYCKQRGNKKLVNAKYVSNVKKVEMKNDWMDYINKKEVDIHTKLHIIQDFLLIFPVNDE